MTDLRIEPISSNDDIDDGLAATIHDPLWLLTRQWQLGEFQGNDAGSPMMMQVRGTTSAIGAYASGIDKKWQRYDPRRAPLDVLVEAQEEAVDLRKLANEGAHFVRLLKEAKLSRYTPQFCQLFGFQNLQVNDQLLALLIRTSPDPRRLGPALSKFTNGTFRALPFITAASQKSVLRVSKAWREWYQEEMACTNPATTDCWEEHRLEHHVLLASSAGDGTVLRAQEYCSDYLDWLDFDIDPTASLPKFSLPKPEPLSLSGIPSPIQFGGMPVARYWEFEDGHFNYGNVEAGRQDLGRLLLIQFTMVFGNDWFLVPLRVPSGTLTLLDQVLVTDVFGQHFLISPSGATDPNWDLFKLEIHHQSEPSPNPVSHPVQSALFLPPSFGHHHESTPYEVVHLLRDEMANLVWAVEHSVRTPEGTVINRMQEWQQRVRPTPPADSGLPRYLVETEVPDYWISFIPKQLENRQDICLVLTPLAVYAPSPPQDSPGSDGPRRDDRSDRREPRLVKPLGSLLAVRTGEDPFWLFEEEVPRAGVIIRCKRRYIRWHGGRAFLWSARSKQTGRGEGSSGLRFDVLV
ncbi:MAG TPA: hypothetical protein PKN47_18270 [Nitrospira sp.]|nr:hypothetical protein [Nitrospira sp.]